MRGIGAEGDDAGVDDDEHRGRECSAHVPPGADTIAARVQRTCCEGDGGPVMEGMAWALGLN